MSAPYVFKLYCIGCYCRMDPNADNIRTANGESVCCRECKLAVEKGEADK